MWIKGHNEHRILFTRLLALGLFDANDHQWDGRLELAANAALISLVAALFVGLTVGLVPFWGALILAALAVYIFGSPISNENTLAGFQSQFYFLLLIPGLHIASSILTRQKSPIWWLAPLMGLAALFTMASGFFSALAVLTVAGIIFLKTRKLTFEILWLAVPNALIAALGWILKVDVAEHAALHASTASAWMDAWLHQLAWPVMDLWFAPIGALPLTVFLVAFFRGKLVGCNYWALLAAGVWSWPQYAAIAYARGGNSHGYASRYTDILSVAVLVNLLMLPGLADGLQTGRTRWGIGGATAFYLGATIWGIFWQQQRQSTIDPLSGLGRCQSREDRNGAHVCGH